MLNRQEWVQAMDICYEIRGCINALDAIHTAMAEGPFTADNFVPGLYFVLRSPSDKQEELENLLDKRKKNIK